MNCIVCRNEGSIHSRQSDIFLYDCPNCGRYKLSSYVHDVVLPEILNNFEKRAILSHAIWKLQGHTEKSYPKLVQIEKILQTSNLPEPSEQINNLLLWLGDSSRFFGDGKKIVLTCLSAKIGAINTTNSDNVYQTLNRTYPSLIEDHPNGGVQLTLAGWQRYRELKRTVDGNRNSLMLMNSDDSDMIDLYENYFRPAVEATGFELNTIVENTASGIIDVRMEVEIRNSRFLIADITHGNKGVYWEAGFACGLDKPVIYTCREDRKKDIHFDTDHRLFVKWHPGKPEKAAQRLKDVIRATLPTEAKMED